MDGSMITVLLMLTVTIGLLAADVLRIDLVALLVMLLLGWTGILTAEEAFSGFSSNAVIAMMGVMMISQGLAKTGIIDRLSQMAVRITGGGKTIIVLSISLMAGLLSGVLITVGVAALFLPVMRQISRRQKIPASDLLMPMGFSAILGANLTMVGSAPLIVLNDLLRSGGQKPYGLLSVFPVGVLLLGAGLLYFWLLGSRILPDTSQRPTAQSHQEKLMETLHLSHHISCYRIPPDCPLIGKTLDEAAIWQRFQLHLLGMAGESGVEYVPWRETRFRSGQVLSLLGTEEASRHFSETCGLQPAKAGESLQSLAESHSAGFAEVIIPPRSAMADSSLREFSLRKKYAVEPLVLFSGGEEVREDFSDHHMRQGDTLVVYGLWQHIRELSRSPDFIVITPVAAPDHTPEKTKAAVACLLGAVAMTLVGFPVSLAFFSGAVAMILAKVVTLQEGYQAIEWKVIFLLAGLIPLGTAMQKTGTAAFLSENLMKLLAGRHPLFFLLAVAALASFFALFMSNVGAVVILTPLVMSMAAMAEVDPRGAALLAAVCASNALILPTHQVNALLLSPGGYRNTDFMRAGGGMSLIYVMISVTFFYFFMI
ncbi:SLC13 family permease [Anoxynatronum sibiricum]|uniref:SLC13 family permease n=1 Tax=Anoxynatronum sibiricum TaxID=210623 RepID=A0ABU9VVY2_9CLOT